jgi:asparagine N-glycosylation enzyme membrane subunit Stt3
VPERRSYFHWTYVLAAIVYLGAAIQILGASLTDKDFRPVIIPAPAPLRILGYIGIFIAFFAPVFAIAACFVANFEEKKTSSAVERKVLWFVAILAVLLSILEFLWTNHPVWLNGFQG